MSGSEQSRAKRDGPDGWRIGAQLDPGNVPGENRGGWDGVQVMTNLFHDLVISVAPP
jgi:hypothetical protein